MLENLQLNWRISNTGPLVGGKSEDPYIHHYDKKPESISKQYLTEIEE
jgi:hypothetical protein